MLESLQQAITRVQSLRTQDYKLKLTNTFGVVVESDEPRWTSGTGVCKVPYLKKHAHCPAAPSHPWHAHTPQQRCCCCVPIHVLPDLIQTLRLVDASCPDGVQLCVFSRDVDAMPKCSLGDVLELTNVVVGMTFELTAAADVLGRGVKQHFHVWYFLFVFPRHLYHGLSHSMA